MHHAYLGGSWSTFELVKLCRLAAAHYPGVDGDLLTAGALLHDVGKIYELSFDRSFGYTSEGQLLGHITIGIRIIEDKLRTLKAFPPRLRTLLEHMVLSHHGQMEFGSPKVPLFAEAVLLHHLDDLDSKIECVRAAVSQDRQMEGEWTGYNQPMDRVLLKKERYLNGAAEPPGAPPASAPAPAPRPAPKPRGATPFGEKLLGALQDPAAGGKV